MKNIDINLNMQETAPSESEKFFLDRISDFQNFSRIDKCRVNAVDEVNGQTIVYFRILSRGDSGFSDRMENTFEANIFEDAKVPSPGSMGIVASLYGSGTAKDGYIYLGTIDEKTNRPKESKKPGDFSVKGEKSSIFIPEKENIVAMGNADVSITMQNETVTIGDKKSQFGINISPSSFSYETNTRKTGIASSESIGTLIKSGKDITLATEGNINLIGNKVKIMSANELANGGGLPLEMNSKNHVHGVSGTYEISSGTYKVKVLSKNLAEYNPLINPISPNPSYVIDILEGGAEFSIGSGDYEINLLNSAPFIGSAFKVNIGTIPFLNSSEMILETGLFEASVSTVPGLLTNVSSIKLNSTLLPSAEMGVYLTGSVMTSGFEASTTSTVMKTSMGLSKIEVSTSGVTIQGAGPTPSPESMVLGDSLVSELEKLLNNISSLTVPTALGPSGPPMNSIAFQIQSRILKFKVLSFFNKNN